MDYLILCQVWYSLKIIGEDMGFLFVSREIILLGKFHINGKLQNRVLSLRIGELQGTSERYKKAF